MLQLFRILGIHAKEIEVTCADPDTVMYVTR